jgi:hypothetical protein
MLHHFNFEKEFKKCDEGREEEEVGLPRSRGRSNTPRLVVYLLVALGTQIRSYIWLFTYQKVYVHGIFLYYCSLPFEF